MFTLLNPAALLALLGLLVPVAIHLWNRRPGREVAVGSLRWLAAGANRRLRNLKPKQLGLLLLRAALLAVLALAVAGPAWRQSLPPGRGQVLLSPALVGNPALAALRPTIDSLRRRGYGLRWLAADFPKLAGVAGLADFGGLRDSARTLLAADSVGTALQWARVQQAAGRFAGQPLYVLTPAALNGFAGAHPPLAANITWQLLPSNGNRTWLQAAALYPKDSLRLLLGQSTESQTTFRRQTVPMPSRRGEQIQVAGLAPLRLQPNANGSENLVLISTDVASSSAPSVPIEGVPLIIEIYATAAFAADARYLQAAVRAAATGLAIPPIVRMVAGPPRPVPGADYWLFWLTDAPLPPTWRDAVRHGAHVWQEAAGPGVADVSHLALGERGEKPIAIFRRGAARPDLAAAPGSFPLWSDGLGRPVLTRHWLGSGAFYQLHTRLTPAWSELADSPALPSQLLMLLAPAPTDEAAASLPPFLAQTSVQSLTQTLAALDQRALDPAQLGTAGDGRQSVASRPAALTAPPAFNSTDLRPWLVLAAGLLFALERRLAGRRPASVVSSVPAS